MIVESLAEYNFITSVAQALMPTTNWVMNAERPILLITDRDLSRMFYVGSSMDWSHHARAIVA